MKNLKPGVISPFNIIWDYQRFASALALSTPAPPTTTIDNAAEFVTYEDQRMSIEEWIQGLRKAFNHAKSLLDALCSGFNTSISNLSEVTDNMSNTSHGYSWLDQVKLPNNMPLLQHLMSDPSLSPATLDSSGQLQWMPSRIIQFINTAAELVDLLAVLNMTVPGQPCRAAELVDHHIQNGLRSRNVFYVHGSLWIITRRVKSENLTQRETFVPVKLPPELSDLNIAYLLFIRPLEVFFSQVIYDDAAASLYHQYLYVKKGKRLLEDEFYPIFQIFTFNYFKCKIGVRGYRQMIVTVARAYLGSEYEIDEEEEEDALAAQRCHGVEVDRQLYGVQAQYLNALTQDVMHRFAKVSEWWWHLVRFAPGEPPLLPISKRQLISSSNHLSSNSGALNQLPTGPFDAATLTNTIQTIVDAAIKSAVTGMQDNLAQIISQAVA